MKIGVTGTRSGMTEYQKDCVRDLLSEVARTNTCTELHHGDCVGVDAEVAEIAKNLHLFVVNHPPTESVLRAFHASDETREPATYFARNRNIVNETDLLIVVPYQSEPQKNGGTWYTHDYAKKVGKPVRIFYPEKVGLDDF